MIRLHMKLDDNIWEILTIFQFHQIPKNVCQNLAATLFQKAKAVQLKWDGFTEKNAA